MNHLGKISYSSKFYLLGTKRKDRVSDMGYHICFWVFTGNTWAGKVGPRNILFELQRKEDISRNQLDRDSAEGGVQHNTVILVIRYTS